MKKWIALLLAFAMVFALVACSSSDEDSSSDDEEEAVVEEEAAEEEAEEETPAEEEPAEEEEAAAEETAAADDGETPVYGGTITYLQREIENYYDPGMLTTYNYGSMWMETLWTLDLSSDNAYVGSYDTYDQLVGQLAADWDFNYDTGEMTVIIRDDVYFHDKEPINGRQLMASDVKYSYDRLLGTDPDVTRVETENDWTVDLPMVESITADDDTFTVVFQFKEGYWNEVAVNDFIVCPLMITSHEWDECEQTWEYAYGTGPFILTGCEIGTQLTFTRNDNYYGYDRRYPENKLPYLDSVICVQIDDTAERLSNFISGNLDWMASTSQVLSVTEADTLKSTLNEDEYNAWTYDSGRPYGIMLRCDTEPFDDVRVRTAMQMALNLEELQTYLGFDDCRLVGLWTSDLTDFAWEWTDEVTESFEYNPEGAMELLAEAGYPDGFEFHCTVLAPVTDVDLYVLVAQQLSEVGIIMDIDQISDIMEGVALNTDPTETRPANTTFGGQEDIGAAVLIYSEQGSNYGLRHNSEEFEQAINDYYDATTMAERNAAAQTMDELFMTNHWVISLGGIQVYEEYTNSAIHGYQGTRVTTNNWEGPVLANVWLSE